ncbi:glycine oxidase ThiO [Niallia sp. NCCP-28]|uniref:glycine oxidase ThiO n=1 Tax=Niallia sp. NCCP-28 TaxID=2934712 RepID=UPI00208D3C7D|nr:glycine oxidase ThiO [Niallia sp. NCCP-28]GKU84445.1 glycine oxidase [Niallia sp. NCCP-28]
MKQHFDMVVVGGGIIGCAIAYYLAKENANVAVLESQSIGGKSTSAAAGMLGAHSEYKEFKQLYPFARSSQLLYQELYGEIKELAGVDFEMKRGGLLKLAFSASEKQEMASIYELPTVEWLNREEANEKVPALTKSIIGAAFLKEDVHITPIAACNGFSKGAQTLGAEIFEYTNVSEITKQDSQYKIKTSRGDFTAAQVVIASGVWSNSFFQQMGLTNRIIPVKGECIAAMNEEMPLKHSIFHDQHYIVPRNNGQLIIGATKKWNDWNEKPTLEGIESVIKKAKEMIPAIKDMKMTNCWAGLRPQTFDGNPFIGEHPEMKGLYFAAGHQRNGILLAPATGKMVRDLLLGNPVDKKWIEAFKVERSINKSTELEEVKL